jgi:hypothetical protein
VHAFIAAEEEVPRADELQRERDGPVKQSNKAFACIIAPIGEIAERERDLFPRKVGCFSFQPGFFKPAPLATRLPRLTSNSSFRSNAKAFSRSSRDLKW